MLTGLRKPTSDRVRIELQWTFVAGIATAAKAWARAGRDSDDECAELYEAVIEARGVESHA